MHPWEDEHWLPGVLSKRQVKILIDQVYIDGIEDFESISDYSSFDLTLSDSGYLMGQGAIKPCGDPSKPYKLFFDGKDVKPLNAESDGYFKLKAKNCYVFKLKERLSAAKLSSSNIYGMATAKSSIGRVDVISRLIIDGMHQYEYLNPDDLKYSTGDMYLEIIPISFDVRVKPGISLSQLRLFYGDPDQSLITDKKFIEGILIGSKDGKGYLSVDLSNIKIGGLDVTAFRANNANEEICIDLWDKKGHDPCKYWCFDYSNKDKRLVLRNGEFYLLRSKERISLPSRIAVYARPTDETLGEMRIHYAGFVHPYFGLDRSDPKGTPLIFEVRAHNVNVNLDDNERLAKLQFYRMSEKPEKDKDPSYNNQELQLSNFFGDWPEKLEYIDNGDGKVRNAK